MVMADRLKKIRRFERYRGFKAVFDRIMAGILLAVLGFPMLLIGGMIRLDSPGPALFSQKRIGQDGKIFVMWKFRSMEVGAEKRGTGAYSEKGDPRVTRIGRLLRAASLDELPQLFNILRGEMSFIGPRPPLLYHPWPYASYTERQKKMFHVMPGLTGWAQVHGRKRVEWNRRIEFNVWYAEHMSLGLDLRILIMTMRTMVKRSDNVNYGETCFSKNIV